MLAWKNYLLRQHLSNSRLVSKENMKYYICSIHSSIVKIKGSGEKASDEFQVPLKAALWDLIQKKAVTRLLLSLCSLEFCSKFLWKVFLSHASSTALFPILTSLWQLLRATVCQQLYITKALVLSIQHLKKQKLPEQSVSPHVTLLQKPVLKGIENLLF